MSTVAARHFDVPLEVGQNDELHYLQSILSEAKQEEAFMDLLRGRWTAEFDVRGHALARYACRISFWYEQITSTYRLHCKAKFTSTIFAELLSCQLSVDALCLDSSVQECSALCGFGNLFGKQI